MRLSKISYLFLFVMGSSSLKAAEPIDQNFGGPYAGGQMVLGQAITTGSSAPGPAYLLGFDLGYGFKRDTWNRLELGVELGTGKANFTDKSDIGEIKTAIDLDLVAMIKAGYGYSLGDNAFGTFRVGLGIVSAEHGGKVAGLKLDGGSTTGVAALLGWDALLPASSSVDLLFGADLRIFSLSFSDIPNATQQINFPGLRAGARVRF